MNDEFNLYKQSLRMISENLSSLLIKNLLTV